MVELRTELFGCFIPQPFIDDLKHHADIVVVIQDYVSLKKSGRQLQGALSVSRREDAVVSASTATRGSSTASAAASGGDVIKFLELHEKVGFHDAVKQLAQRFGMTLPEIGAERRTAGERGGARDAAQGSRGRRPHGSASSSLAPAGARIRRQIADRGISDATGDGAGPGLRAAGARRH